MVSLFSSRVLRSSGVSFVAFGFWLVTLLLPSTACGQGNFLPGVSYPVNMAAGIAVGDINGDRKPDLVVAEASFGGWAFF